ncbi:MULTISPECIES: hydantoinase/oxoprolinase family protein [Bradyrhizobium]|uniref:Hydantoinase/oxoprolinase family protein n=3 Tax=Bradyrhizobium TaxID=374 RepID=A0AAE5X8V8_9BRAD|nr:MULTISPECIES: hydantoinase/oxoprolinase family protein [Bradyrhizobium]MCG2628142.1 hydantoinase/oxoprolinase family protein [Bradyrhizobium zhengyangense]MCG2643261.1 hydantoinase/oxoprolinase family protein [Bradyrhizobium zhengyangense]MCG2670425.1 hydantoinase/oxoprolinase family protein [Bradyrhizobium zhengyangense]MDN4985840.1 hydantoinase/oxoprolinase family protein [Bradyrhizobium sp. WYCCWR 13022]MDN5002781.1 hydantoinase/oxoprolinase family protein [Bradyrhizobium sp. WYCCWR 1267
MRLGADIGGTFTDIVLVDDETGLFRLGKVLTTPDQPDNGVINGIKQVINGDAGQVSHVVHGTTLFTNALIERKGALTALVTTRGFRDAVEIAREHRYDMYDLRLRRPAPIARRRHRFEIAERILSDGTIRQAPNEDDVARIAEEMRRIGIEAVAVSLINAYVCPDHERIVGRILREKLPGVAITLSSDISPEIREFERSTTALCNVYVKSIAEKYLTRLEARTRDELSDAAGLYVMQSNGGLLTASQAIEAPIRLVESGPAAGALAAAHYAKSLGLSDVLSFDMGGTTAKACLIVDGEPLLAPEFEVDRQYQFKKGSGLPVKVPVIEMIEIGTGGGSIAQIDALGRLKVGPHSAGSVPGPACYGAGGERPTVTDADLLLGYLNAGFFLGGDMKLDKTAAERAINEQVGASLDLDTIAAAWGIHQLANEAMASAARIHAIERGRTISQFPMFAFGGAGPVHAYGVARVLKLPKIIYPFGAGVMSAVGFLTAPLAFDFVRSSPARLEQLDWGAVNRSLKEMEEEGRSRLAHSMGDREVSFRRWADMRYRKQGFDIRVPIPSGKLGPDSIAEITASFERVYTELYGHTVPNTPIDVMSWRVVASGPKPDFKLPVNTSKSDGPLKGSRKIYVPDAGLIDVPVYDRYRLGAGDRLQGPAIIEERESTVVINGPGEISVDQNRNLIVDLEVAR